MANFWQCKLFVVIQRLFSKKRSSNRGVVIEVVEFAVFLLLYLRKKF